MGGWGGGGGWAGGGGVWRGVGGAGGEERVGLSDCVRKK